jgi:hypothetical protein
MDISGVILSLPAEKDRFYPCIFDNLSTFDAESIGTKYPDVVAVKPELPLSQRVGSFVIHSKPF